MQRALEEDKPIFLSIGYSACHWCHVMERESFSDPDIAALLNQGFISIKVDREERPDLDEVYMQAVTAMTGRGGWPLSVWLTPDGVPFYGGTYFPPAPRYGMPSFRQVLVSLAELWKNRRDKIQDAAANLREHLRREVADRPGRGSLEEAVAGAALELADSVGRDHGGWGETPKFPQAAALEFLLTSHALDPQPQVEAALRLTLDSMANGGIYDHLGGGFHRYSTDAFWLVPHFEKMLYDNAQLARCYLHAWLVFGDERYRQIAEETLDYLLEQMRHPEGGFYSSEDADSEGREGAFYLWTRPEIENALPPGQVEFAKTAFGITEHGNLEGANVLHLKDRDLADDSRMREVKAALLEARHSRVRPARDDKILAGWNGLTLVALAEAATALDSDRHRDAAAHTGDFILNRLVDTNGRLIHSWRDGRVSGRAFLDDHAAVAEGMLALYAATFDERWFAAARRFVDDLFDHFRRPTGGFFDTSDDHEPLLVRPRSLEDSPSPCGNSLAATVLLRMAAYTGDARYQLAAEQTLDSSPELVSRAPMMFGQWLSAALLRKRGLAEVAVVGALDTEDGEALISPLRTAFRPDVVVAARPAGRPTLVPILQDREPAAGMQAAAWVCRHSTCSAPTADPKTLVQHIEAGSDPRE